MRAPLYSLDAAEIFDSVLVEDPYPFFARLRERGPVTRIGETGVHWVATWSAIEEALEREEDFSANLTGVLVRGDDGLPATFALPSVGASQVIATADEPDHATHRALVQPRLAAGRVTALEPSLRAWTSELLEPWLADGGGEFTPIAEIVPARVVADVLGLPQEDVALFRRWAMTGGDLLAGDVSAARLGAIAAEASHAASYLAGHLEAAMAQPREEPDAPLLHALARGVVSGRIAVEPAIGIAMVLFSAGGESTAALIGSAARRLASDSKLADTLRRKPEQIPNFVEEMLRLEPPFKFHYRVVRRACTLAGATLVPGDRLMLGWASANRDPAVFPDPDTLRLDRRHPKQHLAFGRGPHFCIGAPLARLEARTVIEELLARTRRLRLRPEQPPVFAPSLLVRRLLSLTIDVN
jgi:cytochrome P450